jgi:hypothetical protein
MLLQGATRFSTHTNPSGGLDLPSLVITLGFLGIVILAMIAGALIYREVFTVEDKDDDLDWWTEFYDPDWPPDGGAVEPTPEKELVGGNVRI